MEKPCKNSSGAILAQALLNISAVKFQSEMPFVWGNGWNSPIYNDNRLILSYPNVRSLFKVELAKTLVENYPECNVVAAVSEAAVPYAALVAETLGLPFIYIRSTPKDHGLENVIEGGLNVRQHVVMIEDIVSTGGGSLRAAEAIRMAGCTVDGGICVLNYEFPMSLKRLREADIEIKSLCTYDALVEAAVSSNYLSKSDEKTLKEWRKDPSNWVPGDKL